MHNEPERIQADALPGTEGRAGLSETALEEALVRALRPEMPSPDFVKQVLAHAGIAGSDTQALQTRQNAVGKVLSWPARQLWIGGAVAAALIFGCFEGELAWHRLRDQQRRAASATAQFETSERVTVHALAQAREQLQRAGVPLSLD